VNIPSGRCEEIKKLMLGNFRLKKSRARMPSKRSLGRRHTFCISLDFGQIDFFTSSSPQFRHVPKNGNVALCYWVMVELLFFQEEWQRRSQFFPREAVPGPFSVKINAPFSMDTSEISS